MTPAGEEAAGGAGDDGDEGDDGAGDEATVAASTGSAARSAELIPTAAKNSRAARNAPRTAPQRVRGVIWKVRQRTAPCAPGYFFSRATPRIKATVQV